MTLESLPMVKAPISLRTFLNQWCVNKRMNRQFAEKKKVCCTPSSTPRVCETVDGGPPLVDQDWHAMRQAISEGVEGADWENLCYQYVELHKVVNL